ncbi:MAG: T9SS type A sorting domain-containing protein, partial [Gemmatimonadales bacterium]|nr:T9SS type A sorting domain-containing protein [Gemmatimonadales bacterium]
PAAGTVSTMRSYIGYVNGGNGAAGSEGPYSFTPLPRSFTALGASITLNYSAANQVLEASDSGLARVHTVPDPYYVTSAFEQTTDTKIIKFVNLPARAIIRIYSSSGVLVSLVEHNSTTFGGSEDWNVRNRNNQVVASGVYFYHIESGNARRVGRFTVVNFAQ